jgi:hypothetical protein
MDNSLKDSLRMRTNKSRLKKGMAQKIIVMANLVMAILSLFVSIEPVTRSRSSLKYSLSSIYSVAAAFACNIITIIYKTCGHL